MINSDGSQDYVAQKRVPATVCKRTTPSRLLRTCPPEAAQDVVGIGVEAGAAAQGRMLKEIACTLDFVMLENPRMVLGALEMVEEETPDDVPLGAADFVRFVRVCIPKCSISVGRLLYLSVVVLSFLPVP